MQIQKQKTQKKQEQKDKENMIGNRVAAILNRIKTAQQTLKNPVRLIAVSKTKTVQEIMDAYNVGIRDFGQNYAQEIQQKQPKLPMDIRWHFIGHLQSNKIKKILVPNLYSIQTIDRVSLAQKLQKALLKQQKQDKKKLIILLQIKTSQQDSKSGIEPKQSFQLYDFIKQKCPHLQCKGLMTIGQQGDQNAFKQMAKLKQMYCQKYKLSQDQKKEFELSMGMSADFQTAIKYGSSIVRVGSSIFGARNYPKKKIQNLE